MKQGFSGDLGGFRPALSRVMIAGLAALLFWEFWARIVSPPVIGGPIEPGELVLSFVGYWSGYTPPRLVGEVVHIVSQVLLFPLLYLRLTRTRLPWGLAIDLTMLSAFAGFVIREAQMGDDLPTGIILGLVLVPYALSRLLPLPPAFADAASFGAFTWFLSLAIIAPASGLPFLLLAWGGQLSFMSFVGHTLYGVVLWGALVALARRKRA